MPRGGKRPGSGRPPSATTKRTREVANAIATSADLTPLDYMLEVLKDTSASQQRRDEMARSAAPFVHPKLGAIAMLDAASKLTSIAAVNAISVPCGMFLSREQADHDYRFRNDIPGSIVTPLWTAPGADRDLKTITIEASSNGPGAPRDLDGTPAEAPTIEGEAELVPLRAVGDK